MKTKDPYLHKSAVPLVPAKTERCEGGPRIPSLGNKFSQVMNGVNAEAIRMAEHMDETAHERAAHNLARRRTDAYKLARAAAKRAKRSVKFLTHEL